MLCYTDKESYCVEISGDTLQFYDFVIYAMDII